MTELSDAKLVELAQNGNLEAVGELYDRYWLRIFHYVRARVYNIQLAQDLTGEVFLRMVEHLPRYQVMEGVLFSTWLYRIAHNLVISHRQKENTYQMVPLEIATNNNNHHDNPLLIVEEQWEQMRIQQCLSRIDEAQREVIILRFYAGLSLKEVAAALDKTVGAVKSLQRRGLMTLVAVMKSMS